MQTIPMTCLLDLKTKRGKKKGKETDRPTKLLSLLQSNKPLSVLQFNEHKRKTITCTPQNKEPNYENCGLGLFTKQTMHCREMHKSFRLGQKSHARQLYFCKFAEHILGLTALLSCYAPTCLQQKICVAPTDGSLYYSRAIKSFSPPALLSASLHWEKDRP